MTRCRVPDCNGVTEYDDDAQAVLCTTCGTVAMQDILTDRDGELYGNSLYFGPTTLKSLRRVGGALAGQSGKEDRDRRNTVAMHTYINGLLSRVACSGLTPRAQSLFDQARLRGKYRWGKKAVLVAGACIVIGLRESKKGIMMSDLATLMDVSPHSLCRVFMHVNTLLGLQVPEFDPVALLPGLQLHLQALISSPTCTLSQPIVKMVQPLPPAPVLRLATSLAILVNDLGEAPSPDAPTPATACALFILALEGQAVSSLPSYVLLAQELGKKVGVRKDLVVLRYRDICKVVEQWMQDVPWIAGADHPDNKLGRKRRKTSQRDVLAMGLKDVVQFREEILKARKERGTERPVMVSLDITEEDEDWEQSTECSQSTESFATAGKKRKRSTTVEASGSSSKHLRLTGSRRARPLTPLDIASLALLSPSHPLTSDMNRIAHVSDVGDMQTQILTSVAFPTGVQPTRLQTLAMTRGGECEIQDDELFEEGELEGFLRSEDEVIKLRDFFVWATPDQRTGQQPLLPLPQDSEWDFADMTIWADIGSDRSADQSEVSDIGAQVLSEWREASPYCGRHAEAGNRFDVHGEW